MTYSFQIGRVTPWRVARGVCVLVAAWQGTVTPGHGADAQPGQHESLLGRVGQEQVRVEDVRAFLSGLTPSQKDAVAANAGLLNQLVRSFLVQKLVLKEALSHKWDERPEVVAQITRLREGALTESYLQSLTQPPKEYPSEEEVKAAYEAGKAALLVPRTFRLAQIFVSDPKGSEDRATSEQAQAKVKSLVERLKRAGTNFEALASAESEERQSATRGGEIGWLAESQIQPEIRDQLPGMALNAISGPLRLADGWHIIKVLDVREAHTPTLEQVRGRLVEELRAEKMRAGTQEYLAKLLQENPIAINELMLSKLVETSKP